MSNPKPSRSQTQNVSARPRVVTDPHLHPRRPLPKPADIRQTKEYKAAARKWISTIVALPILMYTSWVLFERTYGNKQPKRLNDVHTPVSASRNEDPKQNDA